MPNFLVELTDGRKFQVEADQPPTEADLQQYMGQSAQPPKERPFFSASDAYSSLKDVLGGVAQTPASIRAGFAGFSNPRLYSEAEKEANASRAQFSRDIARRQAERETLGESSSVGNAFRGAAQSVPYTLSNVAAMGAADLVARGVGAGIGALAGPEAIPVGSQAASMLAKGINVARVTGSSAAGYEAANASAGQQFLNDTLNEIKTRFKQKTGKEMSDAEQDEAYNEVLPLAEEYGKAEAGPETVGNLAQIWGGKYLLGLGKHAVEGIAKRVGAFALGQAVEHGGETYTGSEQHNIEERKNALIEGRPVNQENIRSGLPGYTESFKEQAPTTMALSALGLGGGAAVKGASMLLPKPAPVQAADDLIAAADATGEAPLATAAAQETNNVSADLHAANDLSRYMPPDPQVANDFEEQLRATEDENLFGLGLEAEQEKVRQQQAFTEAQQRQEQFQSLTPNEPVNPAGNAVPPSGTGEFDVPTWMRMSPEERLAFTNSGGVLQGTQPEAVGQASPESVAGVAEVAPANDAEAAKTKEFTQAEIDAKEKIGEGSESEVYSDGDNVIKVPESYNQPETLAERVEYTTRAERLLGNRSGLQYAGFRRGRNGVLNPVFSQRRMDGPSASKEQVQGLFREHGWTENSDGSFSINTEAGRVSTLSDLYDGGNVIIVDGKVVPRDVATTVEAITPPQVSPSGAAPTGIATTTGQPMPGGSGAAVAPVYYHGSQEDFDSFGTVRHTSTPQGRKTSVAPITKSGRGQIYLTQDQDYAATYGDKVKSFNVNSANLASFESLGHKDVSADVMNKTLADMGVNHTVKGEARPAFEWLKYGDLKKSLVKAGFDGFKLQESRSDNGRVANTIALFDNNSLSPAPTQETPSSPAAKLEKEGVVPASSSETEVGGRSNIPVGTKETPQAEVSSADIEANALEILRGKRPNLPAAVAEKAKKYFATGDLKAISSLHGKTQQDIVHSLQEADPEQLQAQLAADKEFVERRKKQAIEDRKAEEEKDALQAKLTESRRTALDSIIGTPTGVEMNAVSPADGQESLALVHNTGDVPGVQNAFVGTSKDFLENPENEKNFPALWQLLSNGRVDEGNFAYGRAFIFTDGIGVNASDRANAERLGVTPAVAAVRRVLIHESLVHRGIYGLPRNLQLQILQWVRQNASPAELDNLAKDYPQYENWATNEAQMLGLCEEFLAKKVEKIAKFPKDGPLAKLFDILRDIWRWVTGNTGEPTVQNLRDIIKLLKAGVEAADARLVNGGKVDIKESKPTFSNPLDAQLANAAERMRQMRENQAPQEVDGNQIRNEIRAAYDRAIVGEGSIQTSLQKVFDEAQKVMPTLTERQFGEQLQKLYEDGSAFFAPADRGAEMLAAGEKWGVYDASGMPASYVGVMGDEVKASKVTQDPRSQLPPDIQQQAKVVSKLGPQALNSHRALKALREAQPKFHAKQESEPLIDVAVNIVDSLQKNGVQPEELNEYLLDSDFLDELGIKMNDSLYQALTMEAYRGQLEKADELENEGDIAGANKMRERVIATHNQWFKSGTDAGQRLSFRNALMLNPRYQGLFLLSHLNEMLSENAENAVKAQTEIKADDVAKKVDEAATQATEDVVDEFASISMDELDRLGEEQLDVGEKSSWAKIKGYIARLGASAIARLKKQSGDIKASNAAESAGDLVKKFLAMSDAEHDADDAATHKALKAELASFLGKGTEAKKKVKKDLVDKEEAKQKEKKPRAKRQKLTAEEKAQKKQERANAVAQRLIYRTQEVFRQGFKNESKQSNADSILKAFRDQVATPVSDAAFIERLKKLNVTEDVAQRMLNTAERERVDHQRMEKNAILDSEEALKKLMHKLSQKLGIFQIDSSSWRKLFSTSTASQSQRKVEMEAAIKADPVFQNLDTDDQQLLADLVDEAWEAQRKKVFESEIKRLTRTKKTSEAGAKAVEDQTEKLLQLVNQGMLTDDAFYRAVAEKFGFKDITQEQKARLEKIAQELQKDDLPPHKRTMLAEEFKDIVSEVAHVTFAQIAADTWVTSVLTGWRTAVTIALAAESGGYQVISTAMSEIMRNPSDLNAWKSAGAAINAWISSMPRNARNALGYLWDGKADRLDPTMANLAAYLDLDKNELRRTNTANALLKSKNVFSRLLGHYLHFFQKFLTALDLFNAASAKEGSAPIAYYQTRKNRNEPFDIKELASLRDFKAARKHIITTELGGKDPVGFLEKSRVDSWANQYMWQQIGKLAGVLENANYNAQQGAMTSDPKGLGGWLYHEILGVQSRAKIAADKYLESAKQDQLNATLPSEKMTAKSKIALAYVRQFAAYNLLSAIGLKFARYAGNRLNQTISFIPAIGALRLHEQHGDAQEMHHAQIVANQAVGLMVMLGAQVLLKAIADEPDEKKRGFGLSGSWDSLTPERKSQLMSSGKQAYTLTIGDKVYKYQNWPMGGIIAAIGSLVDLAQYQPEKWNDKTLPGKIGSGLMAAGLSVSDSASLSQFSELFGRAVHSRDPLDAATNTLSKVGAGWAGGFIPRLAKDVDAMFSPEINRYKTPFEFMAREVPIYRRSVGSPILDIFAKPVAPDRSPTSREFISQPTEPEYKLIGRLNEHGVWFTPASPSNRLVGKGNHKRHMSEEEGGRYIELTGKAYRDFVLKYGDRILSMPRERAKQFVLDKADAIRDSAAKKAVHRLTVASN